MADPLSITASILGVAGAGTKLATTLYTYAETAFHADKSLKNIAQDVSLTSAVINELAQVLKHEDGPRICSESAVQTAQSTIDGCRDVFEEINAAFKRSLRASPSTKTRISTLGRLMWPLKEQRLELIRSNLDKLKSTLTLMLQVLQYARTLMQDHNSSTEVTEQRNQIEALAQINRDYTERYESLVKFLDGVNLDKSSESRRQSAPGSSSVVLPTSTLSSSRFAPSTPKRATSPNARHFDKIIGHLEHAITAIITAEQDLATQFSSYATYELTKLHSCHVASNEAKKALQDTGAYQPNKRPKTAMIMAQPSTTPIQSFSDQPRDPTHGSGLLSFYGISPKASNPTFHPRKAKHSIHPYESEIPRNYGQLQQQQDESCAAIPRRQSHQHSAAGASQAPTHPMYVLPMPQMRQQQQPQQQQQTIPQTYQMPPSFPLPQPQGMPAPPSPFPPPRFAAPPPPRQLGDTELSPALSEQSSGELLYLSAPSSNPPMPGESPSSEPPPSQRRSLASRSTRPTLGATARRKASSSDLHELFKHSSPQGALTTQPDDSSIMQLSLLEEQDKHRRLMEQDAASSEQRAPLNFEAMRPNSLAAAPLMRPPPPGGGMHAASGRPPRLGLAIPPSQMAPPQPGAPTDAQADRAKRLEESKRRVREARHAQFHSSLSSETVFPFPPTALPEMSYGHPTAATPQIPDARSSGAEVHSVHAPPFMYSPRAKSKLGPHDFVWFEGENDTCRATADPALNGAGNNGGGSADVVDELVRRWTTVAV